MEPGLGDREWILCHHSHDVHQEPQWSPVLETGNGPSHGGGWGPPTRCRNGARSWRPGMDRVVSVPAAGRVGAAMEPGLGDREWQRPSHLPLSIYAPQWSPVLETGNGDEQS